MQYGRLAVYLLVGFNILQCLKYLANRHQAGYTTPNGLGRTSLASSSPSFPRKIWYTSKHAPFDLGPEYQANIRRWNIANPGWRLELLTDPGSDEYVRQTFSNDPEIVEVYTTLQDNILRADLFRYLVLLGDGGVYSDVDTEALKPIDHWIPDQYKGATRAVVGVEYDTLGNGRGQALLDLQLVNWTIMSVAGHALMYLVVHNVISALKELAERQNVPVSQVKPNFNDVLATTGPARLTTSTWQYLSKVTGTEFTWKSVTGITEPLLVHDVLILPVTSFANGQTHSNSGPPTDEAALVHHQFKGSWKTGGHAYKAMQGNKDG